MAYPGGTGSRNGRCLSKNKTARLEKKQTATKKLRAEKIERLNQPKMKASFSTQ